MASNPDFATALQDARPGLKFNGIIINVDQNNRKAGSGCNTPGKATAIWARGDQIITQLGRLHKLRAAFLLQGTIIKRYSRVNHT